MGLKDIFKKRKKENVVVSIKMKTKKKLDHKWLNNHIGKLLLKLSEHDFDNTGIFYFRDKNNFFVGLEVGLFGSNFKLNEIEDMNDPTQLMHRYARGLDVILGSIEVIFKKTFKLKYEIWRLQSVDFSYDDFVRLWEGKEEIK